jgi:hypothetical protein
VTPFGLASNAVKGLAGKKGSFTGSALVAVEVMDSKSGELLAAAVRRISPDVLDISATLSTTDTIKSVANELAKKIYERLSKAMQGK